MTRDPHTSVKVVHTQVDIFNNKSNQPVKFKYLVHICEHEQGSKIALIRSYLRVPQAAGQVEILLFLMKINMFPTYANNFCDAGQVPTLRNFEA